jgi:hypothetical protein
MTSESQVDAKIKGLSDWRGKTLSQLRALIKTADPTVIEEMKWKKPSNPSGGAGLVSRRNHLHRRTAQERHQVDVSQRRFNQGSSEAL